MASCTKNVVSVKVNGLLPVVFQSFISYCGWLVLCCFIKPLMTLPYKFCECLPLAHVQELPVLLLHVSKTTLAVLDRIISHLKLLRLDWLWTFIIASLKHIWQSFMICLHSIISWCIKRSSNSIVIVWNEFCFPNLLKQHLDNWWEHRTWPLPVCIVHAIKENLKALGDISIFHAVYWQFFTFDCHGSVSIYI